MKKSLLALAVLGAFAGAAAAQSSLTIFGVVDANVGKDIGSDDKRVGQGAQSRLGFRGVEDIGNGLKANFHFQTRFDSGNGVNQGTPASSTSPFWQAEANVGLAGSFGNVRLGRQYTEAFYHQITVDPWGADTVATLYGSGFITGGIAGVRSNNSISYWITQSGITFGVQIAEVNDNEGGGGNAATPGSAAVSGSKRPVNARLQYAAGPLQVAVSYENPALENDDWTLVSGSYDLGMAKVGAFYGRGTTGTTRTGANAGAIALSTALDNLDRQSFGLTVTAPYGQGQARAAIAQLKGPHPLAIGGVAAGDITLRQQLSLGYHYSLSKRTTIYADLASAKTDIRSGGPFATAPGLTPASTTPGGNFKDSDTGYDFGIKHVF